MPTTTVAHAAGPAAEQSRGRSPPRPPRPGAGRAAEAPGVAARREAGRALALLWHDPDAGRDAAPGVQPTPASAAGFTPGEAVALVHLAAYEGALYAGLAAVRRPALDPDVRAAEAALPPGSRPLLLLQALAQAHLTARPREFYALVAAAAEARGPLSADEARRVVLRARLRRPDAPGRALGARA